MKKSYYLWALISVFMLTACEKEQTVDNDVWNDATKLWMAGEDGSSMYGFINAKGEMVIPAKYVTCSSFSYGYAKVTETESGTDFYFIDKNGNNVNAPAAEQYGTAFINGYINFKEGGKWGKMNTNWTTVIPANYYSLGSTAANGYSCFKETSDGKYGYLDKNGEVVIPANFVSASAFANGIAVVSVSDSIGLRDGVINEKGEYLVELQENTLENLGEGLVSFIDSDWKYGIWDKTGNIILSATYDDIYPFTCGLALVQKDGKYGAINTKGEVVVPVKWSYLISFRDNVAWATMDDMNDYFNGDMTWYAINTKGEQLFQLEEGEVPNILATLGELVGVTCTYWQFHNGLANIYNLKTGNSRYVNKSGQTIYTWNENTGAEAPAFNPTEEDFRNAIKASMLDTEYAPLFEEIR